MGLGRPQRVGHGRLFDRLGMGVERGHAVHGVHGRNDAIQPVAQHQIGMRHRGVQHGRRVGQARGLDDDAVERANPPVVQPAQQVLERGDEVAADRAAETTAGELDDAFVGPFDQQVIEADFAELVDDHGRLGHAGRPEQPVQQRGLAAAEKARQDIERDRGLGALARGDRIGRAQDLASSFLAGLRLSAAFGFASALTGFGLAAGAAACFLSAPFATGLCGLAGASVSAVLAATGLRTCGVTRSLGAEKAEATTGLVSDALPLPAGSFSLSSPSAGTLVALCEAPGGTTAETWMGGAAARATSWAMSSAGASPFATLSSAWRPASTLMCESKGTGSGGRGGAFLPRRRPLHWIGFMSTASASAVSGGRGRASMRSPEKSKNGRAKPSSNSAAAISERWWPLRAPSTTATRCLDPRVALATTL